MSHQQKSHDAALRENSVELRVRVEQARAGGVVVHDRATARLLDASPALLRAVRRVADLRA